MAYSEDYRKRTIEYYREGHTEAQVWEAFKIYPSALRDWENPTTEAICRRDTIKPAEPGS
jgi:hypothetical protein